MNKNMGNTDRWIRIILGIIFVVFAIFVATARPSMTNPSATPLAGQKAGTCCDSKRNSRPSRAQAKYDSANTAN